MEQAAVVDLGRGNYSCLPRGPIGALVRGLTFFPSFLESLQPAKQKFTHSPPPPPPPCT